MDTQSKINKLIQKIIKQCSQKESREQTNKLNEMLKYAEHEKFKEFIDILSIILKSEVKNYYKKSISKNVSDKMTSEIYLAHYTSMETIYSILKPQIEQQMSGLRLSDASYSNDPSEGNYLKDNLIKNYPWLKDSGQDTDAFVCSFVSGEDSNIGDKITYWQSYGKDGLGCSLQLSQKTDLLEKLDPVLYEDDFEHLIAYFKDYFELGGLLHSQFSSDTDKKYFALRFWKAFDKIKFLYKHKGYEYEKEYRFIKTSSDSEEIKEDFKNTPPYLRRYIFDEQLSSKKILTSGSKITIGPRVMNSSRLRKYLKNLAKQSGYIGPQFTCSEIPYRKVW